MKTIKVATLSSDECTSVQVSGLVFCKNCKWTGISACLGKNIIATGRNSKGYLITETGIDMNDCANEQGSFSDKKD